MHKQVHLKLSIKTNMQILCSSITTENVLECMQKLKYTVYENILCISAFIDKTFYANCKISLQKV